ncbi:MAG: ABC transporter substrate-binding protein [Deltaproteobacteria bacterium]|jgi:hypothetical protein|nr:ABC transporter substrate-binding protein [Deltaproteobacteria bacterium]
MSCTLYLTFPPNVLRGAREKISRRYPGVTILAPEVHEEMYEFASTFGHREIPSLAVTAYPQVLRHIGALSQAGRVAVLPSGLPPLRGELAALGMAPPLRTFCIVAVVPGIIAVSAGLKSAVCDWADLCSPDFPGFVGCPPKNTPLPYLAANILRRVVGERAENLLARLDTASNPIDINKRLARNELSAALLIPAFARTFRGGGGKMVWPASGALAIPMLACLSASAPPEASEVLAYIMSEEFQEAVSLGGLLAPVRESVRGFEELEANRWNMYWAGWDCLEEVGAEMLNSPPPKVA